MPLLGAHESVAGGIQLAFDRIVEVGGEALQIFTRNQRQWQAPPMQKEEIALFRSAWEKTGWMPVASHASYLINLASSDAAKAERAVKALAAELLRCRQLGVEYVVIHPGSHGGDGVEQGLENVAKNLDAAFVEADIAGHKTRLLLETTAGQGTGLGSRFEELGWLLQRSRYGAHLGVCVDTCHIFAAGYDLRDAASYQQTFAALEDAVGLEHVYFFHLNDSKKECGSRVDRHEHIGKGCIGLEGFRQLVNDTRFKDLPMTLETPKGKDLKEDKENLQLLRSLITQASR
ncbi:deoxyribonuclease IV [Desulfogranum marinum]|uniref:deoxyribonuclease IV n=1 Tax=Desulfogranum marinum TaxID=453220 RepID=UPI00196676EC|nr:deoxyribonuclease IV [Desulfogranum marinum]MBM9514229.1 deoxyribonuclease IV [Desulfogranum marinum]